MLDEKIKLKRQTTIVSIFALLLFILSTFAVVPPVQASNSYTPATLSIGGATLIAPLASVWQQQFTPYTGGVASVNYQAVGSTAGVNNMLSDVFSLGFSDAPVPANGLATLDSQNNVITPANSPPVTGLAGADPLIQIADGLAPVAIFYNIPGFRGTLNLTGDTVTEIFLQHITSWTDPHILATNRGLTAAQLTALGKYPITVVHRSDGSGTSFALTTYFTRVDGNWTAAGFIASPSPSNFPASELSGKGSGGVAGLVSATNGAVGYGETSYAIGGGMVYAAILNNAGKYILPLSNGAAAAATAEADKVAANPVYSITNANGTASYPISTFTYVLVWQNQNLGTSGGGTWTQGLAYDAVQFLYYIVTQGQSYAQTLQYAPLPPAVVTLDLALIAKINYGGTPFLPPTTTSLTCKSTSVIVGKSVSCTATLSGATSPIGNFLWSSTGAGTFSKTPCAVPKSGKCVATFKTAGASSSEAIAALFGGDLNNAPSIASSSLTVTQAVSKTTLLCKPTSVASGSTTVCTASVIGFNPSGTVSVSQTGGSGAISGSASCNLAPKGKSTTTSTCSVTLTGSSVGSVTLTASYKGDANNAVSSANRNIKVH